MSEIGFLVEEAAEGSFSARALGESIFTQAETLEALREQIGDAVRCHFDEGQCPAVTRLGDEVERCPGALGVSK